MSGTIMSMLILEYDTYIDINQLISYIGYKEYDGESLESSYFVTRIGVEDCLTEYCKNKKILSFILRTCMKYGDLLRNCTSTDPVEVKTVITLGKMGQNDIFSH